MKGSTIGMLVGVGAGVVGVGLVGSALSDIQTAAAKQPQAPQALTVSTSAKVKEVAGGALILGGIGLLLASAVKALSTGPRENPELEEPAAEEKTSDIQSLLFSKKAGWTVAKAKEWARSHKMKYGDVDETEQQVHLRQEDPEEFARFATKPFGRGIQARLGFYA